MKWIFIVHKGFEKITRNKRRLALNRNKTIQAENVHYCPVFDCGRSGRGGWGELSDAKRSGFQLGQTYGGKTVERVNCTGWMFIAYRRSSCIGHQHVSTRQHKTVYRQLAIQCSVLLEDYACKSETTSAWLIQQDFRVKFKKVGCCAGSALECHSDGCIRD